MLDGELELCELWLENELPVLLLDDSDDGELDDSELKLELLVELLLSAGHGSDGFSEPHKHGLIFSSP